MCNNPLYYSGNIGEGKKVKKKRDRVNGHVLIDDLPAGSSRLLAADGPAWSGCEADGPPTIKKRRQCWVKKKRKNGKNGRSSRPKKMATGLSAAAPSPGMPRGGPPLLDSGHKGLPPSVIKFDQHMWPHQKNGGAVEIRWFKKLSGGKSQSRSTTRENKKLSRDLGSPDRKSKNETLVLIFCSHTPDVTAICVMPLITGQHVIVKEGRRHILYINS